MPIAEMQARWLVAAWTSKIPVPSRKRMEKETEQTLQDMANRCALRRQTLRVTRT